MPMLHFIGTFSPTFFKVLHQFLGVHHVSRRYPSGFFLMESLPFHQVLFCFPHLGFLHLRMPSTSYSKWPSIGSGGGLITCLRSGHKVSSYTNETWNVGCILFSGSNLNLHMSLNTSSTMGNVASILDMNFGVRPSGKVTFNNTFLAHLILHFASSGIDLLFVALSGFLHQQLDRL